MTRPVDVAFGGSRRRGRADERYGSCIDSQIRYADDVITSAA